MNVRINKLHTENFKGDMEKIATHMYRLIYVMAVIAIISQGFLNIVFAVKAALILGISILVARETEIFFQSQKSNIDRAEAKEMLKVTRPEVTGILFALTLPVGTPLFVVAIGAFIAIFVGKMIFGGYSYNVFNPAIVGRLFVAIAWPALVHIHFPQALDNYILGLIFQQDLSAELLSPLMELQANGIVSLENMKSIPDLLFKPQYGMLFAVPSILYIVLIGVFVFWKSIDLRPTLFTLGSTLLILIAITITFELPANYILFHLLSGGLLFVTLFMMTDPFTKPHSNVGLLYYTIIFSVVATLIRFLGKDADGVLYALLFANLFVPLLNKKTLKSTFGINLKNSIAVLVLLAVLVGTSFFINTILKERIESKKIVVGAYDVEK